MSLDLGTKEGWDLTSPRSFTRDAGVRYQNATKTRVPIVQTADVNSDEGDVTDFFQADRWAPTSLRGWSATRCMVGNSEPARFMACANTSTATDGVSHRGWRDRSGCFLLALAAIDARRIVTLVG